MHDAGMDVQTLGELRKRLAGVQTVPDQLPFLIIRPPAAAHDVPDDVGCAWRRDLLSGKRRVSEFA